MNIRTWGGVLAALLMLTPSLPAQKGTEVRFMTLEELTQQASSVLVVIPKSGDVTGTQYRVQEVLKGSAPYQELTIRLPDGEGRRRRYQPATPVQRDDQHPVIVFLRLVMPGGMPGAIPAKPAGQYFLFCENAWESLTQRDTIRAILRPSKSLFIQLSKTAESDVVAVLHNPTTQDIVFFHDTKLNPSRLFLRSEQTGELIEGDDARHRMKFDRTIRKSMFKKVPAGGQLIIGDSFFTRQSDDMVSLGWGPYDYGDLKPGSYTVELVYENESDPLTMNAWKGKLKASMKTEPHRGVRTRPAP